jgi:hypothetical protein
MIKRLSVVAVMCVGIFAPERGDDKVGASAQEFEAGTALPASISVRATIRFVVVQTMIL